MGVSDLFGYKADLSVMTGRKDLRVSNAVHKAYIEVNEEGTVAAAATGKCIYSRQIKGIYYVECR